MTDRVLILDFGSQVTQLIARRVREAGVYCEILPCTGAEQRIADFAPKAIILSGSPASVTTADTPRAPAIVFDLGVPVLGICYGEQTICAQLGGAVETGHSHEYGRARMTTVAPSLLLDGVVGDDRATTVWMSHGDKITRI